MFFVMATLISQVTMLNMLIAIMGDTFEHIIENKDLNSVKTKIEVMGELASNIHTSGEVDDNRFLFVITPDEDEHDSLESWEGSIKQMTKFHQKQIDQVESNLSKQIIELSNKVDQSSDRDIAQDRELKKTVQTLIDSKNAQTEEKLAQI